MVANSLNGLAQVLRFESRDIYRERGKQKKAVALYKRSIKILTGALGPDHPAVSMERDRLALLLNGLRSRHIQAPQIQSLQ